MHFDDRLATVLSLPADGDSFRRIQYRQLLDILGRLPADIEGAQIAAGFERLAKLSRVIPASERAAILRQPTWRLRNPRLLAVLVDSEPAVASAAIAAARLDEDDWLALIPKLPVRARGILRHRAGMGDRIDALLESLGVHDRALPPQIVETRDTPDTISPPSPPPLPSIAPRPSRSLTREEQGARWFAQNVLASVPSGPESRPGGKVGKIAALRQRIEAFSAARRDGEHVAANDSTAPRLPLGDMIADAHEGRIGSFDFATDAEGRIVWSDATAAPMVVGLHCGSPDASSPLLAPRTLVEALRHRQPVRAMTVTIEGAPAVAGTWRLDASPYFDPHRGGFIGYQGRFRRERTPAADLGSAPAVNPSGDGDAAGDAMRQILHELRTPANAIQVAAEMIQQNMLGPSPHEYRSLAAIIASDTAKVLAGLDELDRLVKLEGGAIALEEGTSDLGETVARVIERLGWFTTRRNSGFSFVRPDAPVPVPLAEGELEQLVWRLLAVLAGAAAPNEVLDLACTQSADAAMLAVTLPDALRSRDGEALFVTRAQGREAPQALAAGAFGAGFSLRLARAEAAAAGGSMQRNAKQLEVRLPVLDRGGGSAMEA